MKIYEGSQGQYVFLTPEQMGEILAGPDGNIVAGDRVDRGKAVDILFFDDGSEADAIEEGDGFDPSGANGIIATCSPFDIEIVQVCSYGGVYDYFSEGVYDSMLNQNLDYGEHADRVAYYAKVVKDAAFAFHAVHDGKICCSVEGIEKALDRL